MYELKYYYFVIGDLILYYSYNINIYILLYRAVYQLFAIMWAPPPCKQRKNVIVTSQKKILFPIFAVLDVFPPETLFIYVVFVELAWL